MFFIRKAHFNTMSLVCLVYGSWETIFTKNHPFLFCNLFWFPYFWAFCENHSAYLQWLPTQEWAPFGWQLRTSYLVWEQKSKIYLIPKRKKKLLICGINCDKHLLIKSKFKGCKFQFWTTNLEVHHIIICLILVKWLVKDMLFWVSSISIDRSSLSSFCFFFFQVERVPIESTWGIWNQDRGSSFPETWRSTSWGGPWDATQ